MRLGPAPLHAAALTVGSQLGGVAGAVTAGETPEAVEVRGGVGPREGLRAASAQTPAGCGPSCHLPELALPPEGPWSGSSCAAELGASSRTVLVPSPGAYRGRGFPRGQTAAAPVDSPRPGGDLCPCLLHEADEAFPSLGASGGLPKRGGQSPSGADCGAVALSSAAAAGHWGL